MHDAPNPKAIAPSRAFSNISGSSPTSEFMPQASKEFVITTSVQELTDRATSYLDIGYAVHLSGPAGTGKTTLALHIASQIGRRCTLLHGDDELRGSDLLGKDSGYRRQSVRDNYVSSILKTEETVSLMWSSNRLTTACEQGHTLIYDEFTRSPATANNAFLSILEEGILNIPSSGQEKGYIRVHPDFRAIFTSNPEEYVGVHKSQDALLDRMITLEVPHQDRETEVAIVRAKSKQSQLASETIVDIIRTIRQQISGKNGPTIRSAIAIAKILDHRNAMIRIDDPIFLSTCRDVLLYNTARQSSRSFTKQDLDGIIHQVLRDHGAVDSSKNRQNSETTRLSGRTESSSADPTAPKLRSSLEASPVDEEQDNPLEQIEQLSKAIQSVLPRDVAPIASHDKPDANTHLKEKTLGYTNLTDELIGIEFNSENTARRLPRPPSYSPNLMPVGSSSLDD